MTKRLAQAALLFVLVPLLFVSCARVQAKDSFKRGNKQYRDENFRKAIDLYEEALKFDPNMAEAWFYLGSSHQALYRPGKDTPDNLEHLEKAIEAYKKSLEINRGNSEGLKKVRTNTLGALIGIYSDDPYKNYELAHQYAMELVKESPNDPKTLYALANLYEKFEKVPEAEETYRKVAQDNPEDPKACGALAAFYNKPLWDDQGNPYQPGSDRPRRSKFEEAIEVLGRCAALNPNDPAGYQKVATFYWDKAYRDPLLNDEQKERYADKGLEAVNRALELKPDYFEAVIFKGLLYRVKAGVSKDPRRRQQYLEEAAALQKHGLELKKQQTEAAAAAAAAASPAAE